jgi:hypothetical protein
MTKQSTAPPRPGASGWAIGRKDLFKIWAETPKYCCFDVFIAIGPPPFISIPLRFQEAAGTRLKVRLHRSEYIVYVLR